MRAGGPFAGPFLGPLSKALLRARSIIAIAPHVTPYLLDFASLVRPDWYCFFYNPGLPQR